MRCRRFLCIEDAEGASRAFHEDAFGALALLRSASLAINNPVQQKKKKGFGGEDNRNIVFCFLVADRLVTFLPHIQR